MVQATFGQRPLLWDARGTLRLRWRVRGMSRAIYGQHTRHLALVSSVAALTAACSQSGDPPARPLAGDGGRPSVSRPAFTEEEYGVRSSDRVAGPDGQVRKGGGTFKLGSPYRVAGHWYVPREEPGYAAQGRGSWYGDDFHGRKTANGEIFDMRALTAAHPTLPLPSYAYVTNLQNGRTILVRVNDRGPYANDRIIDMSHASARALGYEGQGLANVRVRYAGRAPLNGDDRRERQFLAEQRWNRGAGLPVVAAVRPPDAPLTLAQPFPAGTPGRWSPTAYRSGLAGKELAPPPVKYMREAALLPTASVGPRRDWPPPQEQAWSAPPARAGAPVFAPAAHTGRAYVQVGVFRDRGNAERLRRELGTIGPVEVAPISGAGEGELFRVRLGPLNAADANQVLGQVAARGVSGSRIVMD